MTSRILEHRRDNLKTANKFVVSIPKKCLWHRYSEVNKRAEGFFNGARDTRPHSGYFGLPGPNFAAETNTRNRPSALITGLNGLDLNGQRAGSSSTGRRIDDSHLGLAFVSIPPGAGSLFEVCCATDSHVDRTFFIEVFLIASAQKLHRAVHHEQAPPKFSSSTRLTKGVLCPEKSIRSIKNSTVR
jgi:hypothetical protein